MARTPNSIDGADHQGGLVRNLARITLPSSSVIKFERTIRFGDAINPKGVSPLRHDGVEVVAAEVAPTSGNSVRITFTAWIACGQAAIGALFCGDDESAIAAAVIESARQLGLPAQLRLEHQHTPVDVPVRYTISLGPTAGGMRLLAPFEGLPAGTLTIDEIVGGPIVTEAWQPPVLRAPEKRKIVSKPPTWDGQDRRDREFNESQRRGGKPRTDRAESST